MDLYFPDEAAGEIVAALRAGKRLYIDGEVTIDAPSSSHPEFTLVINAFKAIASAERVQASSYGFAFDNLSTVDELILMDRLEFKWDTQVYNALFQAFFGDGMPIIDAPQPTLSRSDIFYKHFRDERLGIQPLNTGLERLVDSALLFSEPYRERRPGARRHYTPNPASFGIWTKLIDKYRPPETAV